MMVVLLGPPGAGKGTHAAAIRDAFTIPHISTGEMLRGAIEEGSPVGLKAKTIVEDGQLVPDEVMAEMVEERLSAADAVKGFVLDGYPRNVPQARALDGILSGRSARLDRVLSLVVEDAEIVRRLSGRRTCPGCGHIYHVSGAAPRTEGRCDACGTALVRRADDQPEVIARRISVYAAQTEPLVAFYRDRGLLEEVDAMGPVPVVRERILEVLQ